MSHRPKETQDLATTTTRVPKEYLLWAERTTLTEHVSFASFVEYFDLSDRESATAAFRDLIVSDIIRQKRRETLKVSFDLFLENHAERFWTRRALDVNAELVAGRTGLVMQTAGEAQSKVAFGKLLGESGGVGGIVASVQDQAKTSPTVLKRGRTHARIEMESKVARRVATFPRATIKEPWHTLIEAGLQLYYGWQVDLPDPDTVLEQQQQEESNERLILYKLAVHHLQEAKTRQAQETSFDRAHCLDFKDAFVALSGIWNTYSSTANALFGKESTKSAKTLCCHAALDRKDEQLSEMMDDLLKKPMLSDMFDETYRLQQVFPAHRRILDVVRIVIRNIIRPLHGTANPSEGDCVAVWASIFQEGLPLDSRLSILLGEQGCTASTLSKSKLAEVFDTGTQPRKCDGILRVGPIEIGNFEVKRAGASRQEVACQLRKNIKVNKSILLELEKYGLECPLLLCIHGMSAVVFRIRKWQDIWVAGKASSTIVLPSNLHELRMFLQDPVHQVAELLAHYHDYTEEAHQAHQRYQYRQKGEDADDAVALVPKEVIETLEWEQVVIHSPTKPVKQVAVVGHSPLKSRGQQQRSLLERMKRDRKSEQPGREVSDDE